MQSIRFTSLRVLAALLASAVVSLTAQAQTPAAVAPNPGFYLSGGIGVEGREAMRAERKAYNLRLAFAQSGSGAYITGVRVSITPQGKREALETIEDAGPMLYVRLQPGTYRISASYAEQTRAFSVRVGAGGVDRVLYWPAEKS